MENNELSFKFDERIYDFSKEDIVPTVEQFQSFLDFVHLFKKLKCKDVFKNDVLELASYYSDKESDYIGKYPKSRLNVGD